MMDYATDLEELACEFCGEPAMICDCPDFTTRHLVEMALIASRREPLSSAKITPKS
jgi:hypothetical protein